VHDIFAQGKTCYVPQYFKGKPMEMVQILSLEDFQNLPKNKWNIRQPPENEEREDVFDAGNSFMLQCTLINELLNYYYAYEYHNNTQYI
jgi:5-formyltetrahydrofolate cyclo-ligase